MKKATDDERCFLSMQKAWSNAKVSSMGNGLVLVIPQAIVNELSLKKGDVLERVNIVLNRIELTGKMFEQYGELEKKHPEIKGMDKYSVFSMIKMLGK